MKSLLVFRGYAPASKVILVLHLFCLNSAISRGQGTVDFSNGGAPGAVTNSLTGQRAEPGTTFSAALYFAPDGVTDPSKFSQLGASVNIGIIGGIPSADAAGRFFGGVRTANVFPHGGYGMFEVRAWETSFGSTFEEAVANPNPQGGRLALAGESGIMSVLTGDPTLAEPTPPTSLVQDDARVVPVVGPGLRDGFVLDVVPEPSPLVLSLLFCSLFLLVRHGQAGGRSRRRRSNSCRCSQ